MATLEQEVATLVSSIKNQKKRDEAAEILKQEAAEWAHWIPQLSLKQSDARNRYDEGEFIEDAALNQDWRKGFTLGSSDSRNHPDLYDAVIRSIRDDFDAGLAPKGSDLLQVAQTVTHRLLTWSTWYQRYIDRLDEEITGEEYWVAY